MDKELKLSDVGPKLVMVQLLANIKQTGEGLDLSAKTNCKTLHNVFLTKTSEDPQMLCSRITVKQHELKQS